MKAYYNLCLAIVLWCAVAIGSTQAQQPAKPTQAELTAAAHYRNPIIQTCYTTDPAPLNVGDSVLYVFTGHDEDRADFFWMQEWRVYSTRDMVNWQDHGSPLALESFSWADDRAWAAQVVERNGKFYWYVCAHSTLSNGMAIGVAVADRPEGPYRDALGHPLYENGSWDHIDPTVWIDTNGQAWLAWGNPRVYVLLLEDDMIHAKGDVHLVDMTEEGFGSPLMNEREKGKKYRDSYVEGPWLMQAPHPSTLNSQLSTLNPQPSTYYLLYAAGGVPEHISYSSATSPLGPWHYEGEIMPLGGTESFTNHCGVADFRGHHYFFYHTGHLPGGGGFGRSTAVEEFQYTPDGRFPTILPTREGVQPIATFCPYRRVEAETMSYSYGLKTDQGLAPHPAIYVSEIHNGDWLRLDNVDFGSHGAQAFMVSAASGLRGGRIELRTDSLQGTLLGTIEISGTGGWEQWQTFTATLQRRVTGTHDLYLVFCGRKGPKLFNFDWWQLTDPVGALEARLAAEPTVQIASPNGKITLDVGNGYGIISYQQTPVMEVRLPVTSDAFRKLKANRIKADYKMLSGKRLHCTNQANEYAAGDLLLRLYDDGLAFRGGNSVLPQDTDDEILRQRFNPNTSYIIPEGTRRWAQQWSEGYEGFYPLSVSSKALSKNDHWGYPLLVEPTDNVFALITEANIEKGQSASSLYSEGEEYRVRPDMRIDGQTADHSPWRVIILGSLADVVESTLVTDVSEPCRIGNANWVKPGVVSWVYWAYNHGSNNYNIIKKYTDLAATLHLPYVLIDAEWDEMKDGKTIEDAVAYAKSQGVRPLIWYNSCMGWINGAPGPKFRLNKPDDREREFAWCEKIGVAGVKIDFFGGDNQANMDYCINLLEAAARHHLLVNFHGATIPRGWQRTYPNLLSTEGVYGAEWYNNVPTFTTRAARHNATLPFTRNVIGPMDYTPCAFSDSQHPHITTHAHELALTVLFESGLQHLADRPESFLAQPAEVQHFLSALPTAWDETHYVSGYPGESVVLARRKGKTWYVAGINGTDEVKTLTVPLAFIKGKHTATLFEDSKQKATPWIIQNVTTLPDTVICQPRGGFVWVIK